MRPDSLPPELEYLESYFTDSATIYRSAEWLLSDFDAPVWEYNFGTVSNRFLDWNVLLDDGESLLHPKHKDLLEGLRQYLVASTRNASDQLSETNAIGTQRQSFDLASNIVDHLILNAAHYQLAECGLEGLSTKNLTEILRKVAISFDLDGFLDWEALVGEHCKHLIGVIPRESLEEILTELPELKEVTPEQEDDNGLGIPLEQIPYARAALHSQGLFARLSTGWHIKARQLTSIVYSHSLFAKNGHRRLIKALSVAVDDTKQWRELPAVRQTTSSQEFVLVDRFFNYQTALYRLGALHETGVPAPDIPNLRDVLLYEPETAKSGRYRTLPSTVVLSAVKNSIEFHLKHGEHLVSSFCSLALHSIHKKKLPEQFDNSELQTILRKQTLALGVRQVTMASRTTERVKEDYFTDLRNNASLLELVRVYIGGVQIVVGALMARRSGEMIDLQAFTCLDSTEQWLLFLNRKSTTHAFGTRHLQARPIEPIAVQMIKNLIRMQKILKRIGYIQEETSLFASPCLSGTRKFSACTKELFNRNMDFFCDYFQTATNKDGQRYYIRQHQLRRFFAMLFFHSSTFGGLETLQWMLAHTNRRHVWYYITESQGGAALMGPKAQFMAEYLHHKGSKSYEQLAKLLKDQYGTDDFALVDIDELEDEITELMKEGKVKIEPEFFEDENGEQMRIIVQVFEEAA